jgi:hypothetical protein
VAVRPPYLVSQAASEYGLRRTAGKVFIPLYKPVKVYKDRKRLYK